MGDRRALIARDVRHARLQQRLGDGQDRLAVEFLAGAERELLDLLLEGTLSHDGSFPYSTLPPIGGEGGERSEPGGGAPTSPEQEQSPHPGRLPLATAPDPPPPPAGGDSQCPVNACRSLRARTRGEA